MPNPMNAGDRAKASRMRKAKVLAPVDRLWLAEYDENSEKRRKERQTRARSFGASASGRRIKLDVEEHAESVGTGTAAAAAAGAALEAKEEGRRLDALTVNALEIMKEAVLTYRQICFSMLKRSEVLEHAHVEMRKAESDQYLNNIELQGALQALQSEKSDDVATDLLAQLLMKRFGVKMPPTGKRKPVDSAPA